MIRLRTDDLFLEECRLVIVTWHTQHTHTHTHHTHTLALFNTISETLLHSSHNYTVNSTTLSYCLWRRPQTPPTCVVVTSAGETRQVNQYTVHCILYIIAVETLRVGTFGTCYIRVEFIVHRIQIVFLIGYWI